jgi:hypothetical protein
MLTFGTDKLLVIREVYVADDGPAQTNRVGQIVSQFGPNCIDNATDGMILMGCQDRHIRIYSRESYDLENSESFKPGRTIKGSQCEEGTLTKVPML